MVLYLYRGSLVIHVGVRGGVILNPKPVQNCGYDIQCTRHGLGSLPPALLVKRGGDYKGLLFTWYMWKRKS